MVDVRLFGDEYYMRGEGLDGYTLVRNPSSGWMEYAVLSAEGDRLLPTGIRYTGRTDDINSWKTGLPFPMHLDITEKAREECIQRNLHLLKGKASPASKGPSASPPVLGDIKGICLVVDFPDYPGVLPMSEFENFCNDMAYCNYGNNGSLRTFYHDISGGLLNYENVVFGYYTAPLPFSDYEAMPYAQGAQIILGLALNWVASLGFDFSTLSTNPDGSIEAINLMYTGYPMNWAQGMWYHQGSYTGFSANGVHSHDYNCSPANDPLELAVVAHENGHMVGKWPDTYKYNNNTGPDGIGAFDLMCWYGSYTNPVPPNPFFSSDAGWCNVVDVTYFNGLVTDTTNDLTVFKYRNANDTNEFFIFENRSQEGRSYNIEDEGLTIWHIDRLGDNQTTHHQVFLEHANNDINDHSQACFHAGFNDEFALNTVPSSQLYNGDPSGLRIWEIGPADHEMTYKIGAGQSAPSFVINYVNITGDNNGDGFLEPNETGDVNILVSNFGQINSSNAMVSCIVQGPYASQVLVNTLPVNAGVINMNQSIPLAFSLTVSQSVPLGALVDLRFTVDDGTYSTYFTKHLIIGVQVIMANQQVSTCNAVFYDNGGLLGNYTNLSEYITTFLAPSNYYMETEFLSFDLEDEPNCDYDYLKVFNGPSTASPLIGKYCGSNSPGTVVSTHPSGALTFHFFSDPAVTGTGWTAHVSCHPFTACAELTDPIYFSVYPNPASGKTNVVTNTEKEWKVSLLDATGRTVSESKYLTSPRLELDLSSFSEGLYILQIQGEARVMAHKLMIQAQR